MSSSFDSVLARIFNMSVSAKQDPCAMSGTQEPCPCPKGGHVYPMEYEEITVNRAGNMYLTRADNHLYRLNSKRFVYCYHLKLTRHAQV